MPRRKTESIAEDMEEIDNIFKQDDEFPVAEIRKPDNEIGQNSTTSTDESKPTTELTTVFNSLFDNDTINDNEEQFIDTYLATLNKSRAMREAFPDMPEKDIIKNANRLLEKPIIKKKVNMQVDQILNSDVARAPAILLRSCETAMSLDPLDFYWPDGTARSLDTISAEKRAFITDISVVTNNKTGESRIIYKLLDREKAISRLADVVALLTKTKAAIGESEFDPNAENAAARRDEIFNSVISKTEQEPEEPKKKSRGRPKKYFTKDELATIVDA